MNLKQLSLRAVLLVPSLLVSGCDSPQSSAEAAVRDVLKDPDSAKFGGFYFNERTKRACLTVNSKNSMGGYTGNEQVRLKRTDEGWGPIGEGDEKEESQDDCKEMFADKAD